MAKRRSHGTEAAGTMERHIFPMFFFAETYVDATELHGSQFKVGVHVRVCPGKQKVADLVLLVAVGKVLFALDAVVLHELGDHDDVAGVGLPHHAPKVEDGVLHRPLREDVLTLAREAFHPVGVDVRLLWTGARQHDPGVGVWGGGGGT